MKLTEHKHKTNPETFPSASWINDFSKQIAGATLQGFDMNSTGSLLSHTRCSLYFIFCSILIFFLIPDPYGLFHFFLLLLTQLNSPVLLGLAFLIRSVIQSIPFRSVQFSSVTQSCLTLCNPMNRSTPGLPVHHHLLEFTQTHVHRVGDAIQPSHPLSSPSPPAPNSSQHQSLFQWVNSSHEVAKVLESQLRHHSKKSQGWSPSEWTGWISLQSKGLSRVFSNTTVQKHQFFGAQPSSQSNSRIHTWPQEKP